MTDIRIIRLGLSSYANVAGTADEGLVLSNVDMHDLSEVGNSNLTLGNISYSGIVAICSDYSGNIYGVDNTRNCVVKIEEGGRISWVAGSQSGASGNNGTKNDVPAQEARFNAPEGIACDKSGTIYIADMSNHQIRTIKGGKVNVLAGSAGLSGLVDGTGETARFYNPIDVAVDKAGIVWVADRSNNALRKITNDGKVLTVAGNGSTGNFITDDTNKSAANYETYYANNNTATFNLPDAVITDLQGNVFIADTGNNIIKKYTADGKLYRYSGGGNSGRSLGLGGNTVATCSAFTCSYTGIYDLAADSSGNIYAVDHKTVGSRIVKIDRNGTPAEVADWDSNSFHGPYALAVSPAQTLFVVNQS